MSSRVWDLFGDKKPIIAMAHIPALPGTPRYDEKAGIHGLIEKTGADIDHLVAGGVDAIMFCNEDDRPYTFRATMEQVATMSRVITELRPKSMPFGVDFLWDPMAALSIAAATDAAFIREIFTGVYESDMGLWAPNAGDVLRKRRYIGAEHVLVLFNIAPEFSSPLGTRTVAQRAVNAVVSSLADAILVSGPMAGVEPDYSVVEAAKQAVGEETPVFLNTGAKVENIVDYFKVADGVIVGSTLKVDGHTWNPVDPARLATFMQTANTAR